MVRSYFCLHITDYLLVSYESQLKFSHCICSIVIGDLQWTYAVTGTIFGYNSNTYAVVREGLQKFVLAIVEIIC